MVFYIVNGILDLFNFFGLFIGNFCLELFLEQSVEYQDSVVPDDETPLVGVEAARAESLRAVVGRRGLFYGIKGFGASAPWKDLAVHFGFTPDALSAAVRGFVKG